MAIRDRTGWEVLILLLRTDYCAGLLAIVRNNHRVRGFYSRYSDGRLDLIIAVEDTEDDTTVIPLLDEIARIRSSGVEVDDWITSSLDVRPANFRVEYER